MGEKRAEAQKSEDMESREEDEDDEMEEKPEKEDIWKLERHDIVNKWEKNGDLLVSPPRLNDDWVFMYVALTMCLRKQKKMENESQIWLVSNDLMRDHFWRMKQEPDLILWREASLCKYHIMYPDRHMVEPAESDKNCVLEVYWFVEFGIETLLLFILIYIREWTGSIQDSFITQIRTGIPPTFGRRACRR